ncbi:FAD-dependent oxidoreductase [Natrialbaceae archaeon A-CW2]
MSSYNVAIVGGGIFGCSIAKHLTERSNIDVCLLEKEYHFARHQSGRNSGTLHVGVVTEADVKPGTQLSRFTLEGTRRLKAYCEEHDLPICDRGIMKVASTEEEIAKVRRLYEQASERDVAVEYLDGQDEIHDLEPHITGEAGLYSPESATVDSSLITNKLAQQAWEQGADICMGTTVTGVTRNRDGVTVRTDKTDVQADFLINATGVKAMKLATKLGIKNGYHAIPFRGTYYELIPEKRFLVNSNVYPTSVDPSFQVDVHFTRRPDNRVIVGPTGMIAKGTETYGKTQFNLREIAGTMTSKNFWKFIASRQNISLAVNELDKTYRKQTFLDHSRNLIPGIRSEDLIESYAGITHWLFDENGQRVGKPVIEFNDCSAHILMPQPGFTSSFPIGEYVADEVLERV